MVQQLFKKKVEWCNQGYAAQQLLKTTKAPWLHHGYAV